MIDVVEDFKIADRLWGVTADKASNNTKIMADIETYCAAHYPNSGLCFYCPNFGLSVAWNLIECMYNSFC